METLLVITSILAVVAVAAVVSCMVEIKRLKEQINLLDKELHEHNKEILSLRKSAAMCGIALNDLADIVSSKTFNAFPLIGQSGNA